MSYGIQVFNDSGFTQIDGLDRNLQIVATGTTGNWPQSPYLTTSLPSTVDNSVVVFIAPNATFGSGQGGTIPISGWIDYSAKTFTLNRILSFSYYQGSFNYVVCVSNQAEPTSGYGFNTYTSTGDLAFSSAYNQMKEVIHQTYTLTTTPNYTFDSSNAAWESGTNPQDYYVMVNALGRTGIATSGNSWFYSASFCTWGWANSTLGTVDRLLIGGRNFAAPTSTGSNTTVTSSDTRTQVIARHI